LKSVGAGSSVEPLAGASREYQSNRHGEDGGHVLGLDIQNHGDLDERAEFTSVGTGVADIKGSVERGIANGVEWFVVELDSPNDLTPVESVAVSYLN